MSRYNVHKRCDNRIYNDSRNDVFTRLAYNCLAQPLLRFTCGVWLGRKYKEFDAVQEHYSKLTTRTGTGIRVVKGFGGRNEIDVKENELGI